MQKIISLIILALFVTGKMTAMESDTVYYDSQRRLSYDTIPYMIEDVCISNYYVPI